MGAFTLSELEELLAATLESASTPRHGALANGNTLSVASVRLSLSLQSVGRGLPLRYRFADRVSSEATTVVTYEFDAVGGVLKQVDVGGTEPHG